MAWRVRARSRLCASAVGRRRIKGAVNERAPEDCGALRYYKLGETPAYYITAWYNLLSGKWEFGKVHATETTVEGVTVELTTNGRHANYEMKLSGFDLDTSTNKVYGVVLTAADGSEYGLHHVTNIWRGTEPGFNTDEPYLASIIGKTVTQITYYTADGVYVLPVSVAL